MHHAIHSLPRRVSVMTALLVLAAALLCAWAGWSVSLSLTSL